MMGPKRRPLAHQPYFLQLVSLYNVKSFIHSYKLPVSGCYCPWSHWSNSHVLFSLQYPSPTENLWFSPLSCSPYFLQEALSPASVASLRSKVSIHSCYFQFPTMVIILIERNRSTHTWKRLTTESTKTGDQICIYKDFRVVFTVLKRQKEIINKDLTKITATMFYQTGNIGKEKTAKNPHWNPGL